MGTLKKDPAPPASPADGSIIKTDQWNIAVDRMGGTTAPTASRAAVTNGSGDFTTSAVTATELGYLSGALSNIQAQIDLKAASVHTHVKADVTDFAHSHPQADITDLVADLADKADEVHTHVKADVTDFAHTHVLTAGATDVTITAANLNVLDDAGDTALHFHAADRARANHTGTQLKATISDFAHTHPESEVTDLTADLTKAYRTMCDFYIYKSGATYYVQNGKTGADVSNHAEIGAAINSQIGVAGNLIYIESGTHTATTGIRHSAAGVMIVSSYRGATIDFDGATLSPLVAMTDTTGRSFITWKNITFNSTTSGSGTAVNLSYFNHGTFDLIRITGCNKGIISDATTSVFYNYLGIITASVSGAGSQGVALADNANSNHIVHLRVIPDANTVGLLLNGHGNKVDWVDVESGATIGLDLGALAHDNDIHCYLESNVTNLRLNALSEGNMIQGFCADGTTADLTDNSSGKNLLFLRTGAGSYEPILKLPILAGNKISFLGDATNAPINIGTRADTPSALVNGDMWIDTAVQPTIRVRVAGATRTLVASDNTQTITGKTMSGASNTFSAIPKSAINTASTWVVADLPTAIPATNIADGSVTDAEFQYLNTVTSNVQTQLDAKELAANKGAVSGYAGLNASQQLTNALAAASQLPTGIDAAKIADGSVSNTEFQYIGTLTSDAQTQITARALTESAEQNIAPITDSADFTPGTGTVFYFPFTMPSTYKFNLITGIEWKNGATVAGSCFAGVSCVNANPATLDGEATLAASAGTVASGASSIQRSSVVFSTPIRAGTFCAAWIGCGNATHTLRRAASQASVVCEKTITKTAAITMGNQVAWNAASTNRVYLKIYYTGFG